MTKTIGQSIRELRCARGLTQEQLAEHLNVTAQAISKWENGIGMPDISQVVPLAHFFEVSTDMLFGLDSGDVADEIQRILDEAGAEESCFHEYGMLKEALKRFPGTVRLLSALLACGECLLADGDSVKGQEREDMYEECERAGGLILAYCKEPAVLIDTSQWLIRLHCEMGECDKALALSENLPEQIGFNKHEALAWIFETMNQHERAAQCYDVNIRQHVQGLVHSLILSGHM